MCEPPVDVLVGKLVYSIHEMASSLAQPFEKPERELGVCAGRSTESFRKKEDTAGWFSRDRRGRVRPATEHGNLAEGAARSLLVHQMLSIPPSANDSYPTVEDQQQTCRRAARQVQHLAPEIPAVHCMGSELGDGRPG
jgi:hypothetical protein